MKRVILASILAGVVLAALALAVVWLDVPRWAVRATGLSIALVAVLAWLWKLGTPKDALPANDIDVRRRYNESEKLRAHAMRRVKELGP